MVYLLHFEKPLHHAQHYLGATTMSVDDRLMKHFYNEGSKLLKAVQLAGIGWKLVRVWEGDFKREKQLKRYHKSRLLCPVCLGQVSYELAEALVLSTPPFLNTQGGDMASGTGTGRDAPANDLL